MSVILPVYNQETYVAEAIESILNQSFGNFELIIVDDGSTDGSGEIIRLYASRDSRIQAYFEANAGKSQATNFLVKKAVGEWCAFLDADDVMLPHRLETQLAFHRGNPAVDASSSHCYYINEKGNMFGIQRYPGPTTIEQYRRLVANKEYFTCSFTGLMVSRKVYMASGGLKPELKVCEDFEFFSRLSEMGFILLIIPEVLMKYRIHANAVTVKKPILILDTIHFIEQ